MTERIRVLLVEDNPADVDLLQENLQESKILVDLHVVTDGVEAMAFLRREGPYEDAPRLDLLLLDLNLPRKDGREVLAEMKADQALRRIPVVVLTSSEAEEDLVKSYDLQASAYITKPVDLEGFRKIVHGIKEFWFTVVRFPPEA
ncbi:MAG: response regulator [Nitrospinota bacterium]|nr:MAG: response regulator [Nitrospinota bacterium]